MREHLTCVVISCCLALVVLILVPSCDLPPNKSLSESVKTLQEQNESLSKRLATVQELVLDLGPRVRSLEKASSRTLQLDPTAKEFQRVDTSVGTLAVAIKDVQPFADGVRVVLAIGNLTSATFGSLEIKAAWGRRPPTYKTGDSGGSHGEELALWMKSLKEKTINPTQRLRPGYWNKVSLTLPGTPPQEFGYLEISIDSAQIALVESRG